MSERHKPHNGRDRSGNFKVRREDVSELASRPGGEEFLRDDVRLGGAVEDTGMDAGRRGERIEELVERDREGMERVADRARRTQDDGGAAEG